MKIFIKILGWVILIPFVFVTFYLGWQFTISQIHTADCKQLNKEYIPKTYTLNSNPDIKMRVESLYNPDISSTYESVSGFLIYPGIKYGCSIKSTKDFFYTMKIDGYPDLKIYERKSLYLDYQKPKADWDSIFEKELNNFYNWQFSKYQDGAYLQSEVGLYLDFGRKTTLRTYYFIYIYTQGSWGRLNMRKAENQLAFSNFLSKNDLLDTDLISFDPINIDNSYNLIINLSTRTGNNISNVEYNQEQVLIKLRKIDSEYVITEMVKY